MNQPVDILARAGYFSRGVIYLVVGTLALQAALGAGGETTSARGAMFEILQQPFGKIMLAMLAFGLVGFSLWRAIQGLTDADEHGQSAKALAIRAGHLLSSAAHGFLAFWAARILLSSGGSAGSGGSGGSFLTTTGGQVAMGAAGIVLVIIGLAHIAKGWTARFERYMKFPPQHELWARPLCRFGLIARGIVWCVVGVVLSNSARELNASEPNTTEDALSLIAEFPYGQWLLGIIATGLFAFGVYSCLEAIYRRIES